MSKTGPNAAATTTYKNLKLPHFSPWDCFFASVVMYKNEPNERFTRRRPILMYYVADKSRHLQSLKIVKIDNK
jgi:hypothetical protein